LVVHHIFIVLQVLCYLSWNWLLKNSYCKYIYI
jgi:hypothetical protein